MSFDYHGTKWKHKREHILRLDGYLCRIAKRYGRKELAQTVHHIYPADEYPEYAWQDWNLISVSNGNHNKLENRRTGELTALGKQLMKRTIPGIDWRKKKYKTDPPHQLKLKNNKISTGAGSLFQLRKFFKKGGKAIG